MTLKGQGRDPDIFVCKYLEMRANISMELQARRSVPMDYLLGITYGESKFTRPMTSRDIETAGI